MVYSNIPPELAAGSAKQPPTWRAAYSDRTASLMAALAQLAYVPFVDQKSPDPAAPRAERPTGRSDLGTLLGPDFSKVCIINKGDTQAFLAVSADFAILSFRGTHDLGDWHTNLTAGQVPLPGVVGRVMVHRGFLAAFDLCRQEILDAVEAEVPSTLGLYITGHSLGGALAQIASAVLERDNLAACYTFGSPRVGRADFDVQVKCPHYRVVNRWDLVPGVPPPFFMSYRHSGDPRQILKGPVVERRTRPGLRAFFVDVAALARWLISKKLLVIEDHMIWNYRQALDQWAQMRNPPKSGDALHAPAHDTSAVPVVQDGKARGVAALGGFVLGVTLAWVLRLGWGVIADRLRGRPTRTVRDKAARRP